MDIKEFFTREKASEGVVIKIPAPSGKLTEQWLRIRHIDSDEFREASSLSHVKRMELMQIKDAEERARAIEELRVSQLASLVAEWSFDTPFTPENVVSLLKNAPYLAQYIDMKTVDGELFFGNEQLT